MALPIVSSVAVIAAEQLERSAGPAAALQAYRPLVLNLGAGEARERAVAGALRCAVRAGELGVFDELVPLWSEVHGDRLAQAVELATALVARGRADLAVRLAAEEAERQPGARAEYLLGRCLEASGDPEAIAAYGRAAARAGGEPDAADVAFAARARRIGLLLATPARFPEAVADAVAAGDDPAAAPALRLAVAEARLGAPTRFARAAALSTLEDLARAAPRPIADRAVRRAAEHADAMGLGLTPVEGERLGAVLKQIREPAEREAALGRLAALRKVIEGGEGAREAALRAAVSAAPEMERPLSRALAMAAGVFETSDLRAARALDPAESAAAQLSDLGLSAVAALRRGEPLAAESTLSRAADRVRPDVAPPAALWTAARLGLGSPRRGVEAAALRLAGALLACSRGAPPRGFLALGMALRRKGHRAPAAAAFGAAQAAKEPGAALEHGRERLMLGWALAERGEREAALAALREAKELLEKREPGR